MKKKILHVITKSSWGGAQKYVVDITKGLEGTCEQSVIYGAHTFGERNFFEEQLKLLNVKRFFISSMDRDVSLIKEWKSFLSLLSIIRKEKPHVLHLNSPKAAGLGALAGRICGIKKIVYTVHGLALSEDRPLNQKVMIALFSWFTFMLCHKIIFVSHKELLTVHKWIGVKKRSQVIHNGIALIDYKTREESRKYLEKQTGVSLQNTLLLGSIGELNRNKGMTYLLQALEECAPKNVVYVHWGGGELEQALHNEIKLRKLKKNVFLLGFDKEAKTYLSGLDAFVLPSIKEGLGYVLLEAGLAGLATIASDVGGIPEIITHETSGLLVPSKDSVALAQAIMKLQQDKELKEMYGKKLQQHVLNNFSMQQMILKTSSVYFD